MAISSLVGASVRRKEDPRLVQGKSTYTDDLRMLGMAYMAVVRSPHAHARITTIDASAAQAMPGVLAVVTGQEIKRLTGPLPAVPGPAPKAPVRWPLAIDRVRMVGEPVAAVVATDRYIARDAADAIQVEYDVLPAVVDPERAMQPSAPVLHEELGSNVVFHTAEAVNHGDFDKAWQEAVARVHVRLVNQRLIPTAMEPRATVAHQDGDTLRVWSSTQIPHLLKSNLAGMLGIPENLVHLIAPEVGGGFGSKLNVYAEEALVCALARKTGRPVKYVEDRRENFVSTIHGRDQINEVDACAAADGTITGIRLKVIADLGAYFQLLTSIIPTLTTLMMTGPYAIANARGEVYGVLTNKTPTDAYRGAGRPEATYLIERVVDLLAAELKMDPVEIRRKNLIASPEQFPYTTGTGVVYDSGNYLPALSKLLDVVNYEQFRADQVKARAEGRRLGIGFSTYVEVCGMGPSVAMPAGGWESATVRVEPSGKVTVLTGASPHGQGEETTFAQLVGAELGVDVDDVIVLHGDTRAIPYGIGIFGSRGVSVGGAAVYNATQNVKEKAMRIAGHILEAAKEDLIYANGKVSVRGAPEKSMTLAEIASAAHLATRLPPEIEPGLEATRFFEPSNFVYPFGAHAAIVEVDPDTGQVRLLRYVAVDDCGNVINPTIVDGQIHGGIAQGVAQALWEEAVYDESGNLVSGSLLDYAIPYAAELPNFETARTVTPSPVNPMGVKGVGEAGTIGSTPTIINAVVDALSDLGVRHVDMPLRAEKVWKLLHQNNGGNG